MAVSLSINKGVSIYEALSMEEKGNMVREEGGLHVYERTGDIQYATSGSPS
jgi:hypothetical protein